LRSLALPGPKGLETEMMSESLLKVGE